MSSLALDPFIDSARVASMQEGICVMCESKILDTSRYKMSAK